MNDYSFRASDGTGIYAAIWKTDKPKGIVQLIHGMAEHINRYDEFAKYLNSHGWVVAGEDHRGHGKTAGSIDKLGWFAERNGWDLVVEDNFLLSQKLKNEYPDLPYYIFSHSMGSFITRKLISEYPINPEKVILSGNGDFKDSDVIMVKLIGNIAKFFKSGKAKANLLDKLTFSSMNNKFNPGRTGLEWLSRDEAKVDEYIADPYCGFVVSVQFYLDFADGMSYLHTTDCFEKPPKGLPMLFYSGELDPVGGETKLVTRVYETYRKHGFKNAELVINKGGHHENLNEINRDEVYKTMADWLKK
ncbi:MAG: alpha/beta hydrolase [Spirochaetales bacterium]|uniref:Alpha/beta hydrolase n=1 Tax=Candidatus Thalassospirochaeta sargassi TaxID=3119039 RepID=A0AAJ1IIG4_9SPIO|nr:alpha/beta hydrolase [Spirochaetales bacterium]